MGDIREWLESLGLGNYADSFAENDVDLRALLHLDNENLKELGISLGHRKVILAAIAKLNTDGNVAKRSETASSPVEMREDFSTGSN